MNEVETRRKNEGSASPSESACLDNGNTGSSLKQAQHDKSKDHGQHTMSAFKLAQRRYSRKKQNNHNLKQSSSSIASDKSDAQEEAEDVIDFERNTERDSRINSHTGGRCTYYTLKSAPGFAYLPAALSEKAQLELAQRALRYYCEPPLGRTNVDAECDSQNQNHHHDKEKQSEDCNKPINDTSNANAPNAGSMWEEWMRTHASQIQHFTHKHNSNNNNNNNSHNHNNNNHTSSSKSINIATQPKPRPPKRPRQKRTKPRTLQHTSWSTLGYHYNWTQRSYTDALVSPMPQELIHLSKCLLQCMGESSELCQRNQPSAGIVNYYTRKSTMGGHRDDLELDFTKLVISISMGLPAIFLLGGHSKQESPVHAIRVRPGDVMMLGGDSRLRYHGVARIDEEDEERGLEKNENANTIRKEGQAVVVQSLCEFEKNLRLEGNDSYDEERLVSNGQSRQDKEQPPPPTTMKPPFDFDEMDAVRYALTQYRINLNLRQVLPDGCSTLKEYYEKYEDQGKNGKRD